MARPTRCRRICTEPQYHCFAPSGQAENQEINLTVDEYEAIRLIDFEKKTHEECARSMDISRTTVTEIYESARFKISDSLVNGRILRIEGGNYRLCDGEAVGCCKKKCRRKKKTADDATIIVKGEKRMRIAVTYENGTVFQHFGHTEAFKIYDVENNKIVNTQIVGTMGSGHGALAGMLGGLEADTLICGGIGAGAKEALKEAGITLFGGVTGSADDAVNAFLSGKLEYLPDVHCNHHEEEHSCKEHHCGENKNGCGGN